MINYNVANLRRNDDAASFATLQVDLIADLACPWCYLGKRRLDEALQSVHGPSLVNWYPFQLNPGMPEQGMGFEEYLSQRFGDPSTLQPALAELTRAGKAEGINFRFDLMKQVPNTLNAHRVMRLADREGASTSGLAENIMKGFFEEGLNLSEREVLVELGGRSGLSERRINETLDDEDTRRIVLAQEAQVRQSGVTGVPNFLINKRLFVMGVQTTAGLVNVFDQAMFGLPDEQVAEPACH